jgi:uncharacterized membrane protein
LIGFVVVAAVLCLFFGPIGILYAVGVVVFHLLTIGFAALLDPKTYSRALAHLTESFGIHKSAFW